MERQASERRAACSGDSTQFSFIHAKLFSPSGVIHLRPTHDRPAALRQAVRIFPERGTNRRRDDLARLLTFTRFISYTYEPIDYRVPAAFLFVIRSEGAEPLQKAFERVLEASACRRSEGLPQA
jgi:hypothetical protein